MSDKFEATLIRSDGSRLNFVSSDRIYDVMFPENPGGKLLYLSRISSIRILEDRTVPGRWQALATAIFTRDPLATGLANIVFEKTTCLAEVQFYGDDETYLLLTDQKICDKIAMILQNIRFYGHYNEQFPGTLSRIFSIGSYHWNFFTVFLFMLMIGMFCLSLLLLVLLAM